MNKQTMTDVIISAKASKGVTWESMGAELGLSPVWLASACLGMNSATEEQAKAIVAYLALDAEVASALATYPTKKWEQQIPTDPLIYRFHEITGVYGSTLKEVIQEKFGDGIMSAIDFSMDIEKIEDSKGDRVLVTMNGKFLPYKSW